MFIYATRIQNPESRIEKPKTHPARKLSLLLANQFLGFSFRLQTVTALMWPVFGVGSEPVVFLRIWFRNLQVMKLFNVLARSGGGCSGESPAASHSQLSWPIPFQAAQLCGTQTLRLGGTTSLILTVLLLAIDVISSNEGHKLTRHTISAWVGFTNAVACHSHARVLRTSGRPSCWLNFKDNFPIERAQSNYPFPFEGMEGKIDELLGLLAEIWYTNCHWVCAWVCERVATGNFRPSNSFAIKRINILIMPKLRPGKF